MTTRILGASGLNSPNSLTTSAIGLGCMGLSQGYGATDDAESTATIRAALESGVTMFDTAMSYGRGHNERLLGAAVAGRTPRDHLCIATKFGIVRGADGVVLDGNPDHVQGYCEDSLERLGVEYIDLYYLHRVDPRFPIEETVGAMSRLVDAGKVRHIGVSEVDRYQLETAHRTHPLAAVQLEWSLMWREPELDVVPAARRLGIGVVPYSPLGRGLLTATLAEPGAVAESPFRSNDPRFQAHQLEANQQQVHNLADLARSWGITAAQAALGWLLAQGPDVVPIPGSRRPHRARENAMASPLGDAQLAQLAAVVADDRWVGDRSSFAVPVTTRSTVSVH